MNCVFQLKCPSLDDTALNSEWLQLKSYPGDDVALYSVHLSEHSGDERALAASNATHNGHQLPLRDVQVHAEDEG